VDNINTKYAAEIWYRIAGNKLSHLIPEGSGVRTHGWCHSVGDPMVEVTKLNRNTDNVKVAIENANLCKKICDERTLLKNVAISKICGSRIFA